MDIGIVGALLGGLLSLLSPCSVMLLPAFFAYAFTTPAKLLGRTGLFFLGLLATLVPLGVLAGGVGSFLAQQREALITGAAALVILLGLVQIIGIRLPQLGRTRSGRSADSGNALAVFLLGTVYGVAGVCTGPILGSVLTIAASGGSPGYGALLLAVYAAGMTAPLLVLALGWKRIAAGHASWLRPRMVRVGRWHNSWHAILSGVFSLGLGAVLLWTAHGGGPEGLLPARTMYALENWVASFGASISPLTVLFGLAAVLALLAGWLAWRGRRHATDPPEPDSAEQDSAEQDSAEQDSAEQDSAAPEPSARS